MALFWKRGGSAQPAMGIGAIVIAVAGVAGCTTDSETDRPAAFAEKTATADFPLSRQTAGHCISEPDGMVLEGTTMIPGNSVELLVDGPETYDNMFAAIDAARDHINLETYILADDEVGRHLAERLARKVSDGVVVNVIYDAIGSLNTDETYFAGLRRRGINLLAYRPLMETEPADWHNRNHRKILVVDGTIGFAGGINFTDEYRFSSRSAESNRRFESGWRDTHLRIEGPAVAALQESFLTVWSESADSSIADANYFPPVEAQGQVKAAVVTVGGDTELGSRIADHYQQAISAAQERVWITQAYFAPTEAIVECLVAAARHGVDVRLLLPAKSDVDVAVLAAQAHYGELIEAGVRIFEFNSGMLHAKTALADTAWSTVGSSNLDILSLEFTNEVNVIVTDPDFVRQLARTFLVDLEQATEITENEWDDRSLWTKFTHALAKLMQRGL